MSAEAETWAEAQALDCPRGCSAHVLALLAKFADERGFLWASIVALSRRANVSDRQVQRALRQLVERGLLLETGRRTKEYGQFYPVYRMPIERGFASMTLRREAEKAQKAYAKRPAGGDVDVTTSGEGGDVGVTPGGDMGVTPGGDVDVTPEEKLKQNSKHTGRAREAFQGPVGCELDEAFRRVAERWPEDRFDGPRAWKAWVVAIERVDREELAHAAMHYLRTAGEVQRGFCKTLHRWLDGFAFRKGLGVGSEGLFGRRDGPPVDPSAPRFADEAVRARVVAWFGDASGDGERFALSYLDRARLDGTVVVAATSFAFEKLKDLRPLWRELGLDVAPPVKAAPREPALAGGKG